VTECNFIDPAHIPEVMTHVLAKAQLCITRIGYVDVDWCEQNVKIKQEG